MVTNEVLPAAIQRPQIMPLDVSQTRAAMTMHQEQLRQIVDETDWQTFSRIDRKTGERTEHRFLKRAGWRKIAFWYGLDLEVMREALERDERGEVIRAHVVARARHPNGRYADGDGGCSRSERGFAKPEHDIAAVAVTRATNRAISNLVGAGDLSAEEMDGVGSEPEPVRSLSDADVRELCQDLQKSNPNVDAFAFVSKLAKRFDGVIPEPAGVALRAWAWFQSQPVRGE